MSSDPWLCSAHLQAFWLSSLLQLSQTVPETIQTTGTINCTELMEQRGKTVGILEFWTQTSLSSCVVKLQIIFPINYLVNKSCHNISPQIKVAALRRLWGALCVPWEAEERIWGPVRAIIADQHAWTTSWIFLTPNTKAKLSLYRFHMKTELRSQSENSILQNCLWFRCNFSNTVVSLQIYSGMLTFWPKKKLYFLKQNHPTNSTYQNSSIVLCSHR